MQALSDEQGIESLEKKIDKGFAEMRVELRAVRTEIKSTERELRSEIISARSDAREDFRTLLAVVFAMWVATLLAVGGAVAIHL